MEYNSNYLQFSNEWTTLCVRWAKIFNYGIKIIMINNLPTLQLRLKLFNIHKYLLDLIKGEFNHVFKYG